LTGGNEIAQGRGVGDDRHRQGLRLARSLGEFFERARFAVELAGVVII
jgi:hypothetical protein